MDKAIPYEQQHDFSMRKCSPEKATHIAIKRPGPFGQILLPVKAGGWRWNQNTKRPTISPSLKSDNPETGICHCYITDGVVDFLADSTHELAGTKVELLEPDPL